MDIPKVNNIPEFSIKNRLKDHVERFEQIAGRGHTAGLKTMSNQLKDIMIKITANIMAYAKSAALTDKMHKMGLPVDHVPHEIDDEMDKTLNDFDDIMTLELSSLPDTKG